jgi:hypothetical protein
VCPLPEFSSSRIMTSYMCLSGGQRIDVQTHSSSLHEFQHVQGGKCQRGFGMKTPSLGTSGDAIVANRPQWPDDGACGRSYPPNGLLHNYFWQAQIDHVYSCEGTSKLGIQFPILWRDFA